MIGVNAKRHWDWCVAYSRRQVPYPPRRADASNASRAYSQGRRQRHRVRRPRNRILIEGSMETNHTVPRERYDRLVREAQRLPPVITAIVHPCDQISIEGV